MKCQSLVSVNKESILKCRLLKSEVEIYAQHPNVSVENNEYLSLHTIKGHYVFFQMYMRSRAVPY